MSRFPAAAVLHAKCSFTAGRPATCLNKHRMMMLCCSPDRCWCVPCYGTHLQVMTSNYCNSHQHMSASQSLLRLAKLNVRINIRPDLQHSQLPASVRS